MKHYNVQNYIRYKKDLEQSYKRLPKAYNYQEYTRDIYIFFKGGTGAIARTEIVNIFGNNWKLFKSE